MARCSAETIGPDSEAGSKPHEPYSFGEEFTRVNRASVELRYRLLPYLYTLFREHAETGAPVMRPLWFEYPDDQRTYTVEDEYLVGRDLLVAPVVREAATKRGVYFPAGDDWVDWWTGKTYEGGRDAEVEAPLSRLPLFARAGAAIPVQAVVQHTGEMAQSPLSLVVVLKGDGRLTNPAPAPGAGNSGSTSRVYEDAGQGFGYLRGESHTLTVTQSGGAIRFSRAGAAAVSRPLAALEVWNVRERPGAVKVDGRPPLKFSYDMLNRVAVSLPGRAFAEVTLAP